MGVIGTGRQAITQVEAVCAVRPIKTVKVFSRSEERRNRFAAEMRERVGADIVPVASTEEAIRGSQVVVAITKGKLDFGTWERIFYGEFDGRRKKRVLVKVIGE